MCSYIDLDLYNKDKFNYSKKISQEKIQIQFTSTNNKLLILLVYLDFYLVNIKLLYTNKSKMLYCYKIPYNFKIVTLGKANKQ